MIVIDHARLLDLLTSAAALGLAQPAGEALTRPDLTERVVAAMGEQLDALNLDKSGLETLGYALADAVEYRIGGEEENEEPCDHAAACRYLGLADKLRIDRRTLDCPDPDEELAGYA